MLMLARYAPHARSTCALITTLLLAGTAPSAAHAEVDIDSKGELGAESRLFYPDDTIGTIAAIAAVIGTMLGVSRHRHVAPLAQLKTQPAT